MRFSARTRIAKTNMSSIERSFYLFKTRTICAIFLYYWTQCIDGFSLLLQRYVRKGNVAKKPAILSFSLLPNATNARKINCRITTTIFLHSVCLLARSRPWEGWGGSPCGPETKMNLTNKVLISERVFYSDVTLSTQYNEKIKRRYNSCKLCKSHLWAFGTFGQIK